MCGGFVVAYSSSKIDSKDSFFSQLICHINYNFGRITSYVLLGFVFGFLGQSITFSRTISGYLYFAIGILMILMGISLIGKIRFLSSIESSLAFNPKFRHIFSLLMKSNKKISFYFLGMLNGLFPCGLVYFFIFSAIVSSSWYYGGIIMLIFGLSTMPALVGFGYIIGFLKSTDFRELMIKIAGVIIVLYGLYLSYIGFIATQSGK